MKKILFCTLLFLNVTLFFAQEGKTPAGDKTPAASGQIPSLVMERFNREYPGISGNWSTDGENFKVEFVAPQSHLGHIIVYDRNGDVIRRESELDGPKNPGAINDYYKKNYPGEDLKTWSVEEKNGEISYYTRRKEQILRFNKEGIPATASGTAKDSKMPVKGVR
jgi:hypothetical protein